MFKGRLCVALLAISLLVTLCACNSAVGNSGVRETPPETLRSEAPVATATPTPTPASTSTPVPTPSPSPTPELIVPETLTYTGRGDDVLLLDPEALEPFQSLFFLHISGNAEGRHFAVRGYAEDGDKTELFVNTTDPYDGVTFDPAGETVMLEITAKGDWQIDIESVFSRPTISIGKTVSGTSDDVILVMEHGTTATITGNADEHHFAVKSYGDRNNLMVNTTDSYDGTVMLQDDPLLLEVNAESPWSITFN